MVYILFKYKDGKLDIEEHNEKACYVEIIQEYKKLLTFCVNDDENYHKVKNNLKLDFICDLSFPYEM